MGHVAPAGNRKCPLPPLPPIACRKQVHMVVDRARVRIVAQRSNNENQPNGKERNK